MKKVEGHVGLRKHGEKLLLKENAGTSLVHSTDYMKGDQKWMRLKLAAPGKHYFQERFTYTGKGYGTPWRHDSESKEGKKREKLSIKG